MKTITTNSLTETTEKTSNNHMDPVRFTRNTTVYFKIWVVSICITVTVIWLGVNNGLSWISKQAAFALPTSVTAQAGKETLALLDNHTFSPSRLDESTQRRLMAKFFQLKRAIDSPNGDTIMLNFRQGGKTGANAFALPSGNIIITDELIQLAENDEEILGVLAHEIGHLEKRHSLRQVIQTTGLAMIFSLALGDVTSITSFATVLPTTLVQLKYSREFEIEADDYAVQGLQKMGIDPDHQARHCSLFGFRERPVPRMQKVSSE